MYEVEIIGVGSYAPDNIVTNDDLSHIVETNDEWITTRTGIKQRRISSGENTSDLAIKAAIRAMKVANISAIDLDLIIVATITPDSFTPSTACIVQGKIGAVNAMCFDVNAACTGFLYAINIATQFIKTGTYSNALIIGVETLSKIIDWTDRNTCILFGDGAGAAVLNKSTTSGIVSINTYSDGSKGEYLYCPAVPLRNLFVKDEIGKNGFVSMNGREVFKFAVKVIPECIEKLLKDTGYSLTDIKYIVPHQANSRIIENSAKKLNIDESKFYINLDRYGNTSAASIPIALDEIFQKGLIKKGDKLILIGFGGGLTYGATLINWTI
jgi:3-oxoacyl-[acyl-carrier-protein] synthase III